MTDALDLLPEFVARLKQRLEAGKREHPDSLDRAPAELLEEIEQELLDVCGWSVVLFARVDALRERLKRPHPGLRIEAHIAFDADELSAIDYAAKALGITRDVMIRAALSKFIHERLPYTKPSFAEKYPGVLEPPPPKGKRRRKRATAPEPDHSLPCLPLPRVR